MTVPFKPFKHWHVVDGAADRHSRSILSQHRHMRGAHAVLIRGDVVILGIVSLVSADQAPYVVGKAVLCEVLGHLWEVPKHLKTHSSQKTQISKGKLWERISDFLLLCGDNKKKIKSELNFNRNYSSFLTLSVVLLCICLSNSFICFKHCIYLLFIRIPGLYDNEETFDDKSCGKDLWWWRM